MKPCVDCFVPIDGMSLRCLACKKLRKKKADRDRYYGVCADDKTVTSDFAIARNIRKATIADAYYGPECD